MGFGEKHQGEMGQIDYKWKIEISIQLPSELRRTWAGESLYEWVGKSICLEANFHSNWEFKCVKSCAKMINNFRQLTPKYKIH